MKKRFSAFAIVFLVLFAFNACKKPVSPLALYVPKDASAVFVVDTKPITGKIASSGITIDSLANLFTDGRDEYAIHWDDIKNSGIDLGQSIYIFSKQTNSMQNGKITSGGLIAAVNDPKKLEAFLKKQKAGVEVLSGGKYKYIALGDDFVAGWDDKVMIISMVTGGLSAPGKYSTGEGTLSQQQLTTLFTQSESSSIASFGEFRDAVAKPGDIHFYTNTSAGLNEVTMPGMTKVNDLLKDSYTAGVINFENGRIDAVAESHYNKKLSDIINKYPAQNIKTDMLRSYPDTLTAFAVVSFNPKMMVDILHYLGFDVMADSFASSIGFTTSDVLNAFSGDIAIMFSSHHGNSIENSIKNGGFLLAAAIGNKAAFDKVITGLVNKEILTKRGDEYQLGRSGGQGFIIETGNNNLFIASADELIKAYQASASKQALPADIEKDLSNKTMAVYFDINSFLQNEPFEDSAAVHMSQQYDKDNNNVTKNARETFKNAMAFADKGDGKTVASTYRLNFVNNNENSLASLAKFISVAHQESMKHKDWTAHPPLSGMHDSDNFEMEKDTAITPQ